jgi:hypothetical protein
MPGKKPVDEDDDGDDEDGVDEAVVAVGAKRRIGTKVSEAPKEKEDQDKNE